MKRNEHIEDELRELSPFLADLKKEMPYTVPKDYFEQLNANILAQTVEKAENTVTTTPRTSIFDNWIASIQWLWQPRYAMALASIALLITASLYLFTPEPTEQLAAADIEQYIEENIDQFDEAILLEMALADNTIENLEQFDIIELDLDKNALEDYVEEHILDDLDETTLEELL